MPRRSTIDSLVEEVLSELEFEAEAQVPPGSTKKFPFTWKVFHSTIDKGKRFVRELSVTDEELRTPSDALFRHSAVVQSAYKALKPKGGSLNVERYINLHMDGCSFVNLSEPYLHIYDCGYF